MMDTTTKNVSVEVHEAAVDVIRACTRHADAVRQAWGYTHLPERGIETEESWMYALTQLLCGGFGPAKVWRDGPMSLLVTTAPITMGLIFHADSRPDLAEGDDYNVTGVQGAARFGLYCAEVETDPQGEARTSGLFPGPGKRYCLAAIRDGKCPTHGEGKAYGMPVPGKWSFHS